MKAGGAALLLLVVVLALLAKKLLQEDPLQASSRKMKAQMAVYMREVKREGLPPLGKRITVTTEFNSTPPGSKLTFLLHEGLQGTVKDVTDRYVLIYFDQLQNQTISQSITILNNSKAPWQMVANRNMRKYFTYGPPEKFSLLVKPPESPPLEYAVSTGASFGPADGGLLLDQKIVMMEPSDGCSELHENYTEVAEGRIAVVVRGSCDFAVKVAAAEHAGATAVIIVNNVDGGLTHMDGEGGVPAFMISQEDGTELQKMMEEHGSSLSASSKNLTKVANNTNSTNSTDGHENSSNDNPTPAASPARTAPPRCALTDADAEVGAAVSRGPDWQWGDQDGGVGSRGALLNKTRGCEGGSWWKVRWGDSNVSIAYRLGCKGQYDLARVGCEAPADDV